jgi:hypothetical protein
VADGNGGLMKCCAACKEVSPIERFALSKNRHGNFIRHSYCGTCRSRITKQYQRRKKLEPLNETKAWPMPTMSLVEQLDCVRLRKWGGAEPNARFGVPSIGVAA